MSNEKPLLSIGMPVYNGAAFIARALESLVSQDYGTIELIISDNASTDNTLEICRSYASKYKCIRLNENMTNAGSWNNFAKVLDMARGKFFMWAAADDYWEPTFVSAMHRELVEHPDAGVAMCEIRLVRENGVSCGEVKFPGRLNPNNMGKLESALRVLTPRKYNLFLYGLYRVEIIKKAMDTFIEVPLYDRWILVPIALAYRFRYVEQTLHVRTIRDEPDYARREVLELERKSKSFDEKIVNFMPVLHLFKVIAESRLISWQKVVFSPILLGYLFYRRLYEVYRKLIVKKKWQGILRRYLSNRAL